MCTLYSDPGAGGGTFDLRVEPRVLVVSLFVSHGRARSVVAREEETGSRRKRTRTFCPTCSNPRFPSLRWWRRRRYLNIRQESEL